MICYKCGGEGKVYDLCSMCNGSGEGRADGSRCIFCKGRGGTYVECEYCEGKGEVDSDEEWERFELDLLLLRDRIREMKKKMEFYEQ